MLRIIVACIIIVLIGLLIHFFRPSPVQAACHPIPITDYSPTGVAGCSVYGEGLASWYAGPGVARNDCLWPWEHCQAITITSSQTGRSVTVTPTMFCDCYTGTNRQRLVDLDPAALRALGLNPAQGLFPVVVQPASSSTLPDTAMNGGSWTANEHHLVPTHRPADRPVRYP